MSMAVIHISEADAARDFTGLLARVRAGEEIVIEKEASPAVVLRVAAERPLRRLSESLRLAREHGSDVTLDGGFARDLEAIINSHPEPLKNPWG
jgi:prevent-host-death family protein